MKNTYNIGDTVITKGKTVGEVYEIIINEEGVRYRVKNKENGFKLANTFRESDLSSKRFIVKVFDAHNNKEAFSEICDNVSIRREEEEEVMIRQAMLDLIELELR